MEFSAVICEIYSITYFYLCNVITRIPIEFNKIIIVNAGTQGEKKRFPHRAN